MKITLQILDLAKPIREEGPKRRKAAVDMLEGKKSKKEVNYRHREKVTKAACGNCEYYAHPGQPASSCSKVAGEVEAGDVCDLFDPQPESGQGKSTAARRDKSAEE